MDVWLTPAGIDCDLTPQPLATVTIGCNACMAAHCDGDIDYLVEVLVGTTVQHFYSTLHLVSTFSPCGVVPYAYPGCGKYTVRVTMRCNGNPIFSPFENVEGYRQVCVS